MNVTGRVVAGANAEVPVVNAVVHIVVDAGPQAGSTTQTTTDGRGGFLFAARPNVTYSFWATLGIHWGTATSPTVIETMPTTSPSMSVTLIVPASDIYGTVTARSTGTAIPGASMSIADPYGSWWCCLSTDANGTYLLWTISSGPYNVSASANGFAQAWSSVVVSSTSGSYHQDFQLA